MKLVPTVATGCLFVISSLSGCNRGNNEKASVKRAGMSALQADDLFASLDRQKIISYCGNGKPPSPTAKHPQNDLQYPFGFFLFEKGMLMGATLEPVTGGTQGVVWTNVHLDSTDEFRVVHGDQVKTAELLAMLDGTSVKEYEGKNALRIVRNTPCLALLTTRY
jgi:hypothetical protein